jgi:hypothetical protein
VKLLAVALGVLLAVVGMLLVAAPFAALEFGRSILSPAVLYIAAAVRIIFGGVLLWVAPASRAPTVLRVLGVMLVVAGVATPFVGVELSRVVFDWMLAQGSLFTRAWASAAIALGVLIVYVVSTPRKFAA